MKTFQLLAASLLASVGLAQQQYRIDPNSVPSSTRQYWCNQQTSECPLICLQTTNQTGSPEANTCDWNTLTYACVCSTGLSPNLTEFSQTLPYNICTEWGNQCVANCGVGQSACATACRTDHPCGATDPSRHNATASSASGAATTTPAATSADPNVIYNGFGTAAASTPTAAGHHTGAAASLRVWALSGASTFGSLALVGAVVGGFAVVL